MRFDVHVQGHGEGPRSSFMTGAVPPRIRLHTGCRHSFELHSSRGSICEVEKTSPISDSRIRVTVTLASASV
jgi:hypothetical protein